ncbi:nuclear transport factor 2 family protein [Sphaerisporangium sp. NPDC051011]|uniref:nuclear transport factor 2 family protein n=1 Tax=Sphaerisporangium sp. NPDC051011 TaxID=3155792 RepID=UPI0033DA9F46
MERAAPIDGEVQAGRHREVERLVYEFARRVDFDEGADTELLFTEDGYFEYDGRSCTGRDEIGRAYAARRARGPRTARHVFTNVSSFRDGRGALGGGSIMLLFGADGRPPFDFASPIVVADVADSYAAVGDTLLIARRVITPLFIESSRPAVPPVGLR